MNATEARTVLEAMKRGESNPVTVESDAADWALRRINSLETMLRGERWNRKELELFLAKMRAELYWEKVSEAYHSAMHDIDNSSMLGAYNAARDAMEKAQVEYMEHQESPEVPLTAVFLDEVEGEVKRARAKFPENRHPLAALTEELGELANALLELEYGNDKAADDVYTEAVHVACVAQRIAEEGDPSFPSYVPPQVPR